MGTGAAGVTAVSGGVGISWLLLGVPTAFAGIRNAIRQTAGSPHRDWFLTIFMAVFREASVGFERGELERSALYTISRLRS